MNRQEMLAKRVLLLVELDWGGGWVLSTEDAEAERRDGTTQVIVGCLDALNFSDQLDAPGSVGEFDGVVVNGVFPVDVAKLVARGELLEFSTARVSRWIEGTLWEDRELLFRGLVGDPEYREADDPVSFSVEPEEVLEVTPCIPTGAAVTSATWDTSNEHLGEVDIGKAYPTILGFPGKAPWASAGWVTASVGVWARKLQYFHKLIIAGHPVKATTVWICSDAVTTPQEVAVTTEVDGLGRTVTLIDFHAIAYKDTGGTLLDAVQTNSPTTDEAVNIYVGWPDGGGLVGPDGNALRGGGDVLAWALGQCDGKADLARCAAVAPLLNHILIDGVIETGNATMWEWVTRQLLPLLPVSIVDGPEGRYPVVWNYAPTDRDVVATIDLDAELEADFGSLRRDSSGVRNEFLVHYGPSRRLGTSLRSLRVGNFEEEYATCVLDGPSGESIWVEMAAVGAGGDGVVITVTETGAASAAEDPVAKTIDLTFDDGVTKSVTLANLLRGLSMVRQVRVRNDSNALWGIAIAGGEEQTRTASLHRTNGAVGSLICDVSQRRYARPSDPGGRRVLLDESTTDYLYDDASAAAYLRWKAAATALAARRLDVSLPEDRWGWLRRGQVVRLVSSTLYLNDLALVEHPEFHGDGVAAFTFRLADDPLRLREPA